MKAAPRAPTKAATGGGKPPPQFAARTAIAAVPVYEADERQALALLMLPFLMLALSLGLSQTLKPVGQLFASNSPPLVVEQRRPPGSIELQPLSLPTVVPAALRAVEQVVPLTPLVLPVEAPAIPAPPAAIEAHIPTPEIVLPLAPPAFDVPQAGPQIASIMVPAPPIALPLQAPFIPAPIAAITPPLSSFACLPAAKRVPLSTPPSADTFGAKLAAAAQAQTADFVIYSASYRKIAYPMGDVPSLYGACSDLVIRAYRALGIDLQALVQRARVGRGDPNIDHRRTETLRAFFSRYGSSIPPSTFGEDYKPGDIVTYYRPYSRVSRSHIAIVSNIIGPSGQPMIVHNRGWGPQIEDALFVDRITGHYRFTGAPQLLVPAGRMISDKLREPAPASYSTAPKAATRAGTAMRSARSTTPLSQVQ